MRELRDLLTDAVNCGASDLHISVGVPPTCRVDGSLIHMDEEKVSVDEVNHLTDSVMNSWQQQRFEEAGEVDFAYSIFGTGRFRVNIFRQRGAAAMVARVLNTEIPTPMSLGLPEEILEVTSLKRGLVLVTGATGSGKSTTLASLINVINDTYPYHVITLEDPIEYLHNHKKSIVNQREMGTDSSNFASALRVALRQDPDVILLGEMRDLETISTAVTAAETGHLVFATLHTIGAANTIDRIIDVFPPYQQQQIRVQLAEVLQCVISQQLIPKKGGNGRAGAFEIMYSTSATRNLIREAKTYQIQTVMQTGRKLGMQTMDDALFELWNTGEISKENALFYAQDRAALEKKLY